MGTVNLLFVISMIICTSISQTDAYKTFSVNDDTVILANQNEKIHMNCRAPPEISSCHLVDPGGVEFNLITEDPQMDSCNTTIEMDINPFEAGQWRCRIRLNDGVKMEQTFRIRVADYIATINPNITTTLGEEVTLTCLVSKKEKSMSGCHFETPKGYAFFINSTITQSNAIRNKYVYPSNSSPHHGTCAVTILNVSSRDKGLWICGAKFKGQSYLSTINLNVLSTELQGGKGLTTGDIITITGLAAIAAVIILSCYLKYQLEITNAWRNCVNSANSEEYEMRNIGDGADGDDARRSPALIEDSPPSRCVA